MIGSKLRMFNNWLMRMHKNNLVTGDIMIKYMKITLLALTVLSVSSVVQAGVPISDADLASINGGGYCGSQTEARYFCVHDSQDGGNCLAILIGDCGCKPHETACSPGTLGQVLCGGDGNFEENTATPCITTFVRTTYTNLCLNAGDWVCIGLCWGNPPTTPICGDEIGHIKTC